MKSAGCTLLITCFLSLPLFGAGAGPATDPLDEAVLVLQTDFVNFSRLQIQPGEQLKDIVLSSGNEISLQSPASIKVAPAPILAALLPEQIVYCRAGSFHPASSWSGLAGQLDKWLGQGVQGIVLDLRSNGAPDDFDGAAHLAGLFLPAGTPLFNLRDARGHLLPYSSLAPDAPSANSVTLPSTVPLVVLTDRHTSGAAEGLAASLRDHAALVLGEETAGEGGLFADHPLASGQVLHYLVGEVVMPDGTTLWDHPVIPDIDVTADAKKEQVALALIGQQHIADVIGEAAQRHRMSEASLVRGEDPEIDASLAAQAAGPGGLSSPLATQDIVLVDALDSLKAIRFSQQADAASPGGPSGPSTAR
jgi:C-terminal processing protease CtpA/Prc